MSFLIYQRSDPRFPDWIPLTSQQVRLRNLIQVIGINLQTAVENDRVYYTLHLTPMSAPFLTSEKILISGSIVSWKEIEPRQIPNYVPLSAPSFVIRVWSTSTADGSCPLASWGVFMRGLHYLGTKGGDWRSSDFRPKSLIFRLPFGYFTDLHSYIVEQGKPERFVSYFFPRINELAKHSYTVKSLTALHRIQRSVLEEIELGRRLRYHISLYGYSAESDSTPPNMSPVHSSLTHNLSSSLPKSISQFSINPSNVQLSGRALLRVQQGRRKLKLKEEIETMQLRVKMLKDERGRCEGRVHRLKKKTISLDDASTDLMGQIHYLGRESDRLREFKALVKTKKITLGEKRNQLNLRKKQLISELLLIYPLQLVGGSKRYSISEVQLPNAEDYGSESGSQISVALGYTAHLVAMLSFFLEIPLRYPIRHFGSRSRIIDHITTQIPNKEREFPLYFRGREDVYSKYAVYLLNKNIAQLRWYCGLSTPDLRATLPNLHSVLTSRLTIPGWPPSPSDSCEMAEELTEETHQQLFRNDLSLSLDGGLDQISNITNISAPPKTMDNNMQSWLRASFTDLEHLEVAGGNSVPIGEIQHGRAQNRFLSGWKKKTYSESEEIDPRWLTNSLNLELEFGPRPSITPSPPLRLPLLSSFLFSEGKDGSLKSRKRRVGRVEQGNVFHAAPAPALGPESHSAGLIRHGHVANVNPTVSVSGSPRDSSSPTTTTTTGLGLPLIVPSQALTPNHCISEVEMQINAYERRKSICESGRGNPSPTQSSTSNHLLLPILPSPKDSGSGSSSNENDDNNSFANLELPHVDNYPTTDEDKMDDTIADVVRKISLMEMQLNNRFPQSKSLDSLENHPDADQATTPTPTQTPTTPTSHLSSLTILPEDEVLAVTAVESESEVETETGSSEGGGNQGSDSGGGKNSFVNSSCGPVWNIHNVPPPPAGLAQIREAAEPGESDGGDEEEEEEEGEAGLHRRRSSHSGKHRKLLPPQSLPNSNSKTKTKANSNCDEVATNRQHIPPPPVPVPVPVVIVTDGPFACDNCDDDNSENVGRMLNGDGGGVRGGGGDDESDIKFRGEGEGEVVGVLEAKVEDEEDSSSLWFRTEALLSSQSFNLVKRRISESN